MDKVPFDLDDSPLTPEAPGTPGILARTFNPGSVINGNVHQFLNVDTGLTGNSMSKLTASLNRATPARPTDRIRFVLSLPKVQTVDGIDVVHHTNLINVEFVLHEDSSRDERRDAKNLGVAMISEPTLGAMITVLEDLY